MTWNAAISLIVTGHLALLATDAPAAVTSVEGAGPVISAAAPSPARLIDELLRALGRKDRDALRRLRLTESEYREIVLPGNVDVGQPLRTYPAEVSEFAWRQLDTKSAYYEDFLVRQFGGRSFKVKAIEYEKGTQQYATYRAHKQLRLTLEDGDGAEVELRTGSVAEIAGQFKFVSFIRD